PWQSGLAGRPPLSCPALTAIGRVRVRRGEAGGEALLARAWRLAVGMDELQRTAPVAIALAEAAWLRGDHAQARAIVDPVYREARRLAERKSTRLNSSHVKISYAVFCLKKKKRDTSLDSHAQLS